MDGDLLVRDRVAHEVVDRTDADLVRAVDVERTHDGDGHAVLLEVRVQEELTGQLRDGVRPTGLADLAARHLVGLLDLVRVTAEDLTRREVDEALQLATESLRDLRDVRGAHQVDAHRADRALEHRRDTGDRRHVDDVRRTLCGPAHVLEVEDVALHERHVRMLGEVRVLQRVVVQVVVEDNLVLVGQQPGDGGADEAGAAGQEDSLALNHPRSLPGWPARRL